MNKNIWILIMGFFLFQACLDDEGNYSYSDLLPIEIDSSKMSNSYRITQLDYLVVDPEVKQGVDDSNLSYEWRIFQESNMPNSETGKVVNDVVGQERKLNYFGRVGFGQVFLAVEFVCGDQRALFHLVENVLHVDETAFFQVDVYTGSQELFDQHRDVELVGIVSGQVASFDVAPQRFGDHLESRTVGYVLVVDMVDGRCRFGNVHLRVQPAGFGLLAAVGHYFCERYFDDPVFGRIDSGRFEVEEDDRIFQIQFHGVRVVFRVSGTYIIRHGLSCGYAAGGCPCRRFGYALIIIGISSISVSVAGASS